MKRSRTLAAVVVSLVAVLPTAGCYQGFDNTVSTQPPSGDGVDFRVGDLLVQDTTIVTSPENPDRASVVFTVFNTGAEDDSLASVTVGGTDSILRTAPLRVPSGTAVKVGGDSDNQVLVTGLTTKAGSYAEVTMTFRNAGATTRRVLVVPGTGYYADYAPSAALK